MAQVVIRLVLDMKVFAKAFGDNPFVTSYISVCCEDLKIVIV